MVIDNCDIKCCKLFLLMQNIKAFKLILLLPSSGLTNFHFSCKNIFVRKKMFDIHKYLKPVYSYLLQLFLMVSSSAACGSICNYRCQHLCLYFCQFVFSNILGGLSTSPQFVVAERKGLATPDLGGTEVPRRQ